MKIGKFKITLNSPVILGFTALCFIAFLINMITAGTANKVLFSCYRASLLNPLTYVRFFGHAIGHASWAHLSGNITMILVIGPLLEEKYGSKNILFIIIATAFFSGIANFIFFPKVGIIGASGVVFAMILLASFASVKNGEIPVTLILVAFFYIGGQIYEGLFSNDNISHFSHIIGGLVGAASGFMLNGITEHRNN